MIQTASRRPARHDLGWYAVWITGVDTLSVEPGGLIGMGFTWYDKFMTPYAHERVSYQGAQTYANADEALEAAKETMLSPKKRAARDTVKQKARDVYTSPCAGAITR